jgi:hypothetical protein
MVAAHVTQARRALAVLRQVVLAIQALRAIVTVHVSVMLALLAHVILARRATVVEHVHAIQAHRAVAVLVLFAPVSQDHNAIAMELVVVPPVRCVLVVLNRHVHATVLTVNVKWARHVPVMPVRTAPVTWVRHATVA